MYWPISRNISLEYHHLYCIIGLSDITLHEWFLNMQIYENIINTIRINLQMINEKKKPSRLTSDRLSRTIHKKMVSEKKSFNFPFPLFLSLITTCQSLFQHCSTVLWQTESSLMCSVAAGHIRTEHLYIFNQKDVVLFAEHSSTVSGLLLHQSSVSPMVSFQDRPQWHCSVWKCGPISQTTSAVEWRMCSFSSSVQP